MGEGYEVIEGEVVTASQRIRELEDEIRGLRGEGSSNTALAKLLENPASLQGLLNLNPEQSRNVKALVTGAGAGLAVKYFGKHVGDELAAVAGAAISAYLARRLVS